jgi:hypothetical protein
MNENDLRIIMCLVNAGNKTGKTIHHETGIVESGVSKHLNALRITGIVEYVTCAPRDGKKYTGKCWYLVNAPDVFETLLNLFLSTEYFELFLGSDYVGTMEIDNPRKCNQIVIDLVLDKLHEITPLLDMFSIDNYLLDRINMLHASASEPITPSTNA